ncbi:MAG TPA: DUF2905 domain-containing protein [Myxococcota bacterium]|nr:DUF2905 domain-containing protein [Myxococcota bacterium]
MGEIAKGLMLLGLLLLGLGALLALSPHVPWLGRLPGDIRIERPSGSFYFPITTCLVISVVLSILAHLFSRLR